MLNDRPPLMVVGEWCVRGIPSATEKLDVDAASGEMKMQHTLITALEKRVEGWMGRYPERKQSLITGNEKAKN